VKHGYTNAPKEWEYSSFHKYVQKGDYDIEWGTGKKIEFEKEIGNE